MMTKIRFAVLGIGTVMTILYIVFLYAGAKYDKLIESLPKEGYSDKELFSAGFFLQKFKRFSTKSATGRRLVAEAGVLHPEQEGRFAEYWARIALARTISMTLLLVAGALLFAATSSSPYMLFATLIAGVCGAYAMYDGGVKSMQNELKKRSDDCVYEFANMVSKLSLLMNCSLTLHDAWKMVAESGKGGIYDLMKVASDEMDSGKDDVSAIYDFGVRCNAPEIRKFSGTLIQSVEKGGSDITRFLRNQAKELGGQRKQMLLRRGDEAAAKLLLPTTMFMGGVILIILVAAAGNMSMGI